MINLMPHELKKDIVYARKNVSLAQYCILVAIVAIALTGVMAYGIILITADQNALKESISSKRSTLELLKKDEADANKLSKTIDTINALLDREVSFSKLLQDIGALMPEGTKLTGISLASSKDQPLTITAMLDEQKKAAVLQQNLLKSGLFSAVDIQAVNSSASEDGSSSSFTAQLSAKFASTTDKPEKKQ